MATTCFLALAVVAPKRFDTLLFVRMKGHPRIDGRPILLGDRISFVLPVNWRNRDLALEEPDGLAFAE